MGAVEKDQLDNALIDEVFTDIDECQWNHELKKRLKASTDKGHTRMSMSFCARVVSLCATRSISLFSFFSLKSFGTIHVVGLRSGR